MKGVLTMTIKDKLNLMDEIKAANESRVKAFLEEGKFFKSWLIDYAAVLEDGSTIETERGTDCEPFIVSAPDIAGALYCANDLLTTIAPGQGWKKWMIWNIGIVEDQLF